jgi:hypothetical protein
MRVNILGRMHNAIHVKRDINVQATDLVAHRVIHLMAVSKGAQRVLGELNTRMKPEKPHVRPQVMVIIKRTTRHNRNAAVDISVNQVPGQSVQMRIRRRTARHQV